jgi:mannose-6-phosphate isomerase-like protein (cupin superfamily)
MAVVGATIENPVTGEAITWIETAATNEGSLLAFDLALKPDAALAAEHRHLRQEEHFRVETGRLGLRIGGEESELAAGEDATVPAGVPHRWWPLGSDGTVVRVELRPALETELFFETFFGLGRDGKTNRKGTRDSSRSPSPTPNSAIPAPGWRGRPSPSSASSSPRSPRWPSSSADARSTRSTAPTADAGAAQERERRDSNPRPPA